MIDRNAFVTSLRAAAPYVHAHRDGVFVITFHGEVVNARRLHTLVHDIALLHGLGARLVLVPGARPQIERSLRKRGIEARYAGGLRVTDRASLECVKEAVGAVRIELESLLSMGLPDSPMAGARIRVASGNFVIARPLGVVGGTDYQSTGEVRRIDGDAMRQRLDDNAIVIVPPLGYSPSGEIFNLSADDVAGAAAAELQAEKLIYLVAGKGLTDEQREVLVQLTPKEADALVKQSSSKRATPTASNGASKRVGSSKNQERLPPAVLRALSIGAKACRAGVHRTHIVGLEHDGALLLELFTLDGVGTLVSREPFDHVRRAESRDLAGIVSLLTPLEQEDVLTTRWRERLETNLEQFCVLERDGVVIGCAALEAWTDKDSGELASLAIHPDYRDSGRGDLLLRFIETRAKKLRLKHLYVLTTRTSHWFREHAFKRGRLNDLPTQRRNRIDRRRKSQVFVKTL